MKVSVKDLNVSMELGNNGIELDVFTPDGEGRLGDLRIGKATIEWCAGKIHKGNGISMTWKELIAAFETHKEAEKEAAKKKAKAKKK